MNSSNQTPSNDVLPDDIINVLSEHADVNSIINFSHSCRRFHTFFNEIDSNYSMAEITRTLFLLLKKIMILVKRSEQVIPLAPDDKGIVMLVHEIENLLKLFPELLTYRATVRDHAGRKLVNRTVYQIALAYADDGLIELMEKHFLTLPNGYAIMKQQFQEQFPDGVIKTYPKFDEEMAFEAFKQALDKIGDDPLISYDNGDNFLNIMSNAAKKSIDNFQAIIAINPKDEYTIGLINDMKFYQKTVDYYVLEKKFISPAHHDVCLVLLIGGQQRLFTANMGQALSQGFYNIAFDRDHYFFDPLHRSFKLLFHNSELFFPIDDDSQCKFRLGYHFFIDNFGRAIGGNLGTFGYVLIPAGGRHYDVGAKVEGVCQEKITNLDKLMQRFQLDQLLLNFPPCKT